MKVHVVIPAYRVEGQILDVISRFGEEVEKVWVIDDLCPNGSGILVKSQIRDKRVTVIFNEENLGVGGATLVGYSRALKSGADVIVKVDGDGQMYPEDIPSLIKPILQGEVDYTKGNRFDSLHELRNMPWLRILGNAALALLSKASSGYWSVNDPTNGFTAVHRSALERVDFEKLSRGYFFESDMLFRLNLSGAVVRDVSLPARYGNEVSGLRIGRILLEFPLKHWRNHAKRIIYRYYLREWSIGSIELVAGLGLLVTGAVFGASRTISAFERAQAITAGQVTVASLAIILGVQFLLSFISYDIQSEPKIPLQKR